MRGEMLFSPGKEQEKKTQPFNSGINPFMKVEPIGLKYLPQGPTS
jgi:hypothetical protein